MSVPARLALACLLVFGLSASAWSQEPPAPPQQQSRPERPFRALFGGNSRDKTARQSLDLSISVSANYNDILTALDPTPGLPGAPSNPWLRDAFGTGLNIQPSYTRRWKTGLFLASSEHNFSYYPGSALKGVAHWASASFSNSFGQFVDVQGGQTVRYSPFYGMAGFLGQNSGLEAFAWNSLSLYDVASEHNLQLATTAGITAHVTHRISLTADYGRQSLRFTEQKTSFSSQSVGGRLQAKITRHASVHAGYTQRFGNFGTLFIGGVPVKQHDIDAGLDYDRALSLTRRTTFGFATGETIYTTPFRTFYGLLVNAHLDREIGRIWTARAEYRRGLEWIQGFPQPVYSDRATLGAGGSLSSRAQLLFGAAYLNGEPGLSGVPSNMKLYVGQAQLRYALTRFVALSSQYVYYHQKFGADFPRPAGVPEQLDRQSVLVGVVFWLPLLR